MTISGTWKNSYGSVMALSEISDGLRVGSYSSSTGSTGKYHVLGWAAPETAAHGRALALAIFWRSFAGGPSDPSWHWVSGMSGQRIDQHGVANLVLMHAMVATDDFPNLAPVGTYLDKLTFVPGDSEEAAERDSEGAIEAIEAILSAGGEHSPVSGSWRCAQRPDTALEISGVDESTGAVRARLETRAGSFDCVGFADPRGDEGRASRPQPGRPDRVGPFGEDGSMALPVPVGFARARDRRPGTATARESRNRLEDHLRADDGNGHGFPKGLGLLISAATSSP